jgi:hypothetical protein
MPVPDFSPGEVLTAAAMDSIGLWLVKTQTIGATVASVTVSDAFGADFDNYLITVSGGAASTNNFLGMSLGGSITGYYQARQGIDYSTGARSDGRDNNTVRWTVMGAGSTDGLHAYITLNNPALAKFTSCSAAYSSLANGANVSGIHQVATAYTSFIFTASTGTWTGGTIRVYGYRN